MVVIISNLTYYELLELPRNAKRTDIKRAYRRMAEDYHPDKTMHLGKRLRELANLEMTRINKAKEVLLDDEKRKKYNEFLDGKRTEDLEDIILEVDPFEEYEEENWEEIREEILEVEPLEEAILVDDYVEVETIEEEPLAIPKPKVEPVRPPPAAAERQQVPQQPQPKPAPQPQPQPQSRQQVPPPGYPPRAAVVKLPFWKRLKTKVAARDMGSGIRKLTAAQRSKQRRTPRPAGVSRPPPRVPPPPPGYIPKEDDIRVNIISKQQAESKKVEIWDKYAMDARSVPDEISPIEMEVIDEDGSATRKIQEEKRKAMEARESRLKGLEPKDDFKPKWTKESRIITESKEEKKEKKKEWKKDKAGEEDTMDLEPMEMELVSTRSDEKKRKDK
jgi:curved DNA-binding protein CbpA